MSWSYRQKTKYGSQKVTISGETFDSKREARRYGELLVLERAGQIKDLRRQVRYELIPAQKDADGKVVERSVSYVADFVYYDRRTMETVVEDTKGFKTPEYIIKRKLMLFRHGIRIIEV